MVDEAKRPVYKVIQWATGNVGKESVQAITAHPDFELVGAFVYSADKAGHDVGALCGGAPSGVIATSDAEALLDMEADCVLFNALGDTVSPQESEEFICRLLASGKNVVSTAVSSHIHPKRMDDQVRARIEEACRIGGSTFHSTGVNPGFAFDVLPIQLSALSQRIDHIHCQELVDLSRNDSKQIVHDAIGMGRPPVDPESSVLAMPYKQHPFYVCALMLEEAFGIEFDDMTVDISSATTPVAVQCPWGTVEPGTVAALRMRLQGLVDETVRCTWDLIWRVSDDVAPEWPRGDASWSVTITGDPTIRCTIDVEADIERTVSLLTSVHAVNAIRMVVAAEPGIHTRLDMPLSAGGRFAS